MARKIIIKDEDGINVNTIWRVMYKDKDFKIHERKFNDEYDAKAFFETIDKPNRTKQLDMIKEAKYYTIEWILL